MGHGSLAIFESGPFPYQRCLKDAGWVWENGLLKIKKAQKDSEKSLGEAISKLGGEELMGLVISELAQSEIHSLLWTLEYFKGEWSYCTWKALNIFHELNSEMPNELIKVLNRELSFWNEMGAIAKDDGVIKQDAYTSSKIGGRWPSICLNDQKMLMEHMTMAKGRTFPLVHDTPLRQDIMNFLLQMEFRIPTASMIVAECETMLTLAKRIPSKREDDRGRLVQVLKVAKSECRQSSPKHPNVAKLPHGDDQLMTKRRKLSENFWAQDLDVFFELQLLQRVDLKTKRDGFPLTLLIADFFSSFFGPLKQYAPMENYYSPPDSPLQIPRQFSDTLSFKTGDVRNDRARLISIVPTAGQASTSASLIDSPVNSPAQDAASSIYSLTSTLIDGPEIESGSRLTPSLSMFSSPTGPSRFPSPEFLKPSEGFPAMSKLVLITFPGRKQMFIKCQSSFGQNAS